MQKYLAVGVFICLAGVALSASTTERAGGKFAEMKEKMKKCGDGEINVDEFFKGKKECFAKYKTNSTSDDDESDSEERRRRSPDEKRVHKKGCHKNACVAVCIWKSHGILDASGKFNETQTQQYVNKVYPEAVRADALTKMKECNTNHSYAFSMEDNCKGYREFKGCMMKSHAKVCGIEMKGWKGGKGGKGKGGKDQNTDEE